MYWPDGGGALCIAVTEGRARESGGRDVDGSARIIVRDNVERPVVKVGLPVAVSRPLAHAQPAGSLGPGSGITSFTALFTPRTTEPRPSRSPSSLAACLPPDCTVSCTDSLTSFTRSLTSLSLPFASSSSFSRRSFRPPAIRGHQRSSEILRDAIRRNQEALTEEAR